MINSSKNPLIFGIFCFLKLWISSTSSFFVLSFGLILFFILSDLLSLTCSKFSESFALFSPGVRFFVFLSEESPFLVSWWLSSFIIFLGFSFNRESTISINKCKSAFWVNSLLFVIGYFWSKYDFISFIQAFSNFSLISLSLI